MAMPYAFLRMMEGKKIDLDKSKRSPKEQTEFLMQGRMAGKYLGACLDSCRWGSCTTVMYEMGVKGMIDFIQNWMRQNKENFQHLWHEKKIEELYTKFELPFIHHETCPRYKEHKGAITDFGGRLRCAHESEQKFKPSFVEYYDFFDKLSGMKRRNFHETGPDVPFSEDGFKYDVDQKHYERELEIFEKEEPTFLVNDVCYAIISEKGRILPLETILKRLNLSPETVKVYCNTLGPCKRLDELSREDRDDLMELRLCQGHIQPHNKTEFPFDGWDLAFYVQKWYQQLPEGKVPLFEK